MPQLSDYRTLGRSGLVVSPLALGTMTFGTARWGLEEAAARTVFDAYIEAGGNFIDTADVYAGGRCEAMLGGFIAESGLRDQIVLATKAGFSTGPGPHAGGSGAKQLHIVYASPGAVAAFRTTGGFPDGTVLVKEVFDAETGAMTTGTVSHAKTIAGWFVMVKDSKNSHPGNALWGDGWGWSWFDAANPNKTTSTDYKADCQACHEPAKATDWIYSQGYPVLQKG